MQPAPHPWLRGTRVVDVRHAGRFEIFAVLAREALGALARVPVHLVHALASIIAGVIGAVICVFSQRTPS